ncbi:hypothetical protein V6N12_043055 [Hibiscus sabdariffa]|uniref:Uncharacterized protein n=1 Tax=Hibiscus sabdariffa TaxID=183260 RepID=A0ABR2DI37_9ROSI
MGHFTVEMIHLLISEGNVLKKVICTRIEKQNKLEEMLDKMKGVDGGMMQRLIFEGNVLKEVTNNGIEKQNKLEEMLDTMKGVDGTILEDLFNVISKGFVDSQADITYLKDFEV